jgi:hypothetical protein
VAASPEQLAAYLDKARQSPRLTAMFGEFSDLASGAKGAPDYPVTLSPELLGHDALCLHYATIRNRHASVFNQHFVASLPYVLEEQCRFGAGVLRYGHSLSERMQRPLDLYTLGDASGVTARTLTEIAEGAIHTLTCSPNPENEIAFLRGKPERDAHFYLGPFFDVTKDALRQRNIVDFDQGFDLIVEDTTFQMYGRERLEPIQLASRNLRADGIFVLLEKFMHPDRDEFIRRELQKDDEFKARFFSREKIEQKRQTIVTKMDLQLATLDETIQSLSQLFAHAVVIWNSGNFHTVAASNNADNLARFVNALVPPAIPPTFRYVELPLRILGKSTLPLVFREPSLG